jgi:hypothetical protein
LIIDLPDETAPPQFEIAQDVLDSIVAHVVRCFSSIRSSR